MSRCRNCDVAFEGQFCPQCGQKDVDLERPLAELVGGVVRETFDVDGRAARTLWTLLRWPGRLTRTFLDGRRRRYTPPLRLYIVVSVLFFIVAATAAEQGILLTEGQTAEADVPEQVRFFADELPQFMFLFLPVFALLLKGAFPRRLLFDHLIHSLHLHSAAYIAMAVVLPLERAANVSRLALLVQLVVFAYLLAYFVLSLRHVYAQGWLSTSLKSVGIFFVYLILMGGVFEGASRLAETESAVVPLIRD